MACSDLYLVPETECLSPRHSGSDAFSGAIISTKVCDFVTKHYSLKLKKTALVLPRVNKSIAVQTLLGK